MALAIPSFQVFPVTENHMVSHIGAPSFTLRSAVTSHRGGPPDWLLSHVYRGAEGLVRGVSCWRCYRGPNARHGEDGGGREQAGDVVYWRTRGGGRRRWRRLHGERAPMAMSRRLLRSWRGCWREERVRGGQVRWGDDAHDRVQWHALARSGRHWASLGARVLGNADVSCVLGVYQRDQ
jgi:hypothetical protein